MPAARACWRVLGLLLPLRQHLCAALTLADRAQRDGPPTYAEGLAAAAIGGMTRLEIEGPLPNISSAIDEFLIPRLEWRVSHCSGSEAKSSCVLVRAPDKILPHFFSLDELQFPAKREDGTCSATVEVSGQWVGAATASDLVHGFEDWINSVRNEGKRTVWLPIWSHPESMPIKEGENMLYAPLCGSQQESPTTIQDCFFLPMSSCHANPDQWETIRTTVGTDQTKLIDATVSLAKRTRRRTYFEGLNTADIGVLWGMAFYRQNARTRLEVARREEVWRSRNPDWPASGVGENGGRACAAVHVRHGDKLLPFWINAHDTINGGFNKSLDEYVDTALQLLKDREPPGAQSQSKEPPLIFVMSDDLDIIKQSKKMRRAKLHTVDPGTPLRSLSEARKVADEGTNSFGYEFTNSDDMLSWLLSIRLMSACDSFVGNFESYFARFIYRGMCGERNGRCPRTITFGRASSDVVENQFTEDVI